ncbi:MAG: DnaA/Hda family protein [Pseudomonadota bacterium]
MGTSENYDSKTTSHGRAAVVHTGAPLIWQQTLDELKKVISPWDYERYIIELRFIAEWKGDIVLAARSPLTFARVGDDHKRTIQRIWKKHDPKKRPVRLISWDRHRDEFEGLLDGDPWAGIAAERAIEAAVGADDRDSSIGGERAGQTFATLIEGASNAAAASLARAIVDETDVPSRLILLYGLQGLGKTHILSAIQNAILAIGDNREVLYTTAQAFRADYVSGAMSRDTRELKARMASADVILVDDLQVIADNPGTDQEFCDNLRTALAAGALVIMTADAGPAELQGFSARLRSHLQGAASVEVELPDLEMRKSIVRQKAATLAEKQPNFVVSEVMVELICQRVHGPGRELCGAVLSLYTETNLGKQKPSVDILMRVLDRQAGARRAPTINLIKRAAADVFGVTKAELEGPRKYQTLVYPRHLSMYLCREMTDKSYPVIASQFGKRDHTSVIYAIQRTNKYLVERPETALHLEQLRQRIHQLQDE